MARALVTALLLVSAWTSAGCGQKPSEEACKAAVENLNAIYKAKDTDAERAAAVRRCRARSTKESVACMTAAKTQADAQACEKK